MKRKSMLALLLAVSMTCSMTAATGAVAYASDDTATEETADESTDDAEATEEDADAADEEIDSEDTVQDDAAAEEPEISGEAIMALGEDCTQYVRQYPCLSMSEGISCMGDGYDRTYDYGDYIVYTFADRAKTGDYVQEIDLVTDAYSTNAGIHVGSTREEVEAAYGVSDNDQYGSSEGGYFAFLYDGDVVSLIMYCLD